MGIGPITYCEIESYRRQALDDLTAWEVRLIRRVDNAVRDVIAGQMPKAKAKGETAQAEPEGIPVSDVKSIKSMFRGIAAARKAKRAT